MLMAAMNPDLPGPIIWSVTAVSYWAGVLQQKPVSYLGGFAGRGWRDPALSGDLGREIRRRSLMRNFRSTILPTPGGRSPTTSTPISTRKVSLVPRFEKWWAFRGPHAEEIQFDCRRIVRRQPPAAGEIHCER